MSDDVKALIAEARRLQKNYGDSYEVMLHMSALADALEASVQVPGVTLDDRTPKPPDAGTVRAVWVTAFAPSRYADEGRSFDRWLATVRADAWDEGHVDGYSEAMFYMRGMSSDPDAHTFPRVNPYRAS